MARPASKAVGGYYPTPPSLVPVIAALLDLPAVVTDHDGDPEERALALVDPCAGEGAAVFALARAIAKGRRDLTVRHYVAELEATRAKALKAASDSDTSVAKGDAFRIRFETERDRRGASLVFLNPPYDEGHLETRWLERFKDSLTIGGVLVFVVPVGTLASAASILGRSFENFACFRFPPDEYDAFRQVVLLARRRETLLHPDSALVARLEAWTAAPDTIPMLPAAGPAVLTLPAFEDGEAGFSTWEIAPLDVTALAKSMRPWRRTDRRGSLQRIPGILPAEGARALGAQTFPVAMPLGEGHVPAALGYGVMNGARFSPDDSSSGLPEVYAKAVFRKRWKTAERRTDKYGDVVGEVQVQQPELRITVLDLTTSTFHTPRSSAERTDALRLADMTAADVLFRYQGAFRGVLERRCPALHDPKEPSHALALPALPRPLFTAQAEVTRAVVKLLETERAALVLGEVGVGKSTVTLATAATIGARRIVIVCPPHLLDSWKDQAKAVLPDARTMVLADVADIDAFARAKDEGAVIGILAQTAGKLRHAWAGVGDAEAKPVQLAESPETPEVLAHRATFLEGTFPRRCPRCGEVPDEPPEELARRRVRCASRPLLIRGHLADLVRTMALTLLPVFADAAEVSELFPERHRTRLTKKHASSLAEHPEQRASRFEHLVESGQLLPLVRRLVEIASFPTRKGLSASDARAAEKALLHLLAAICDEGAIADASRTLYASSLADRAWYGAGAELRTFARMLLLLLPPAGPIQARASADLRALGCNDERYGTDGWKGWTAKVEELTGTHPPHRQTVSSPYHTIERKDGLICLGDHPLGESRLAFLALEALRSAVKVGEGERCGEPLYAAVPRPRRVPLAKYLAKRYPGLVDLAVIDECHECANADSAQAQAMAKFMGTRMLLLTGSLSNGYAVGLFAILWTISRRFRNEFSRNAVNDFGRTYGYERRYVDYRDRETGKVVAFGANSDRVERRRSMGWAPGVLPSLILKHVLPISVVLHMEDLKVDLPPRTEAVELVDPGEEMGRRVQALRSTLVAQIKSDRFGPLAGKLFGAMAEEWSSADRASEGIGNGPDGIFRVTYPESGGGLVATLEPMPRDQVLPKEYKLLEIVRAELAEGRAVLIFVWHSDCGLFERLARLIERELDERCPILHADKVPAKKREAWINSEILAKKRRVLLVNPIAVGTGLNTLVHFSTIVWFQPPGCAPKALRQAEGRVHRIGQKKPTRVFWLLYKGTSQEILHRLLLLKVAESVALDGLDPTSALEASGVGTQEGMSGFDVGRAIFEAVRDERFLPPPPLLEASTPSVSTPPSVSPIAALPALAVEPAPLVVSPELVSEAPPRPATPAPAPAPVLRPAPAATPLPPPHIIEKAVGPAKKSVQLTWSF
jgi:hypothetical protein